MTVNQIKEKIRVRLPQPFLFLIELASYWKRLCRYNASINTERDKEKMEYILLRENHVIEKGMSMRHPRQGFGQAKVLTLIDRLKRYYKLYGHEDKRFMYYPMATIKAYISYHQKDQVDITAIQNLYLQLCQETGITDDQLTMSAGIEIMQGKELELQAKKDFSSLLYNRHSIRYFKDEPPSIQQIEQALRLASRTPSACNRQAWHTHVFYGADVHELLRMQGGCNGFCDDIHCCIIVTADMKGFLAHEPFQCYIDGGMYAQNLINALHYVGLGSIPLSCGFMSGKLLGIQKHFSIPKNEVMIVIIGTGIICNETKIAISTRKPILSTNTYHKQNTAG